MSFGLKNTEATYQRLINKVFVDHIRRMMEVYVDDMASKTIGEGDHYKDLWEIFGQIMKFNMCFNPEKCAFGVQRGKFLKLLLTSRGNEAKWKSVKSY